MNLWESFLDLLFPPKCPFCQKILDDPRAPVCPECQGKLPWLLGEDALRAVEGTAGCLSPLAYRDGVPEAVRRYKFPGNPSYGKPFGLLMAQCAQDGLTGAVDVVTWTPLSRRRKKKRGFDQAELLARTAAGELGLPARRLLEKEKDNGPPVPPGGRGGPAGQRPGGVPADRGGPVRPARPAGGRRGDHRLHHGGVRPSAPGRGRVGGLGADPGPGPEKMNYRQAGKPWKNGEIIVENRRGTRYNEN